ncbi:MAG: replication/maintenance protein RepL [Dehalococcoidales bacterium]
MKQTPIEEYLKLADSRSLDVLFWLLHQRDSDGVVVTTLEAVASECKITKVTVNRVFQRLYKAGFLVKIRNGQYQLKKV